MSDNQVLTTRTVPSQVMLYLLTSLVNPYLRSGLLLSLVTLQQKIAPTLS